jgi:putative spermidine/putrescine transport system permease protein
VGRDRVAHDVAVAHAQRRWDYALMIPTLFMLLCYLIPLGVFLVRGARPDLGPAELGDGLTVSNYTAVFSDPFYRRILWTTVKISALVTLFVLVTAYPFAYFLERDRYGLRRYLVPLVVATAFVTVGIRSIGWTILLGSEGPVNKLLIAARLVDEPIRMTSNTFGVVVGIAHFLFPLVVLILMGVIRSIPYGLEEAAASAGAPRYRVLWRVVLPLSLPGTMAAGMLSFAFAMGSFTSTVLLGGGRVLTMPVAIYQDMLTSLRYGRSAAVAGALMAITILIHVISLVVYGRLTRRFKARPAS